MSWTATDIQTWLGQCADRMIQAAPELNELDGKLGDGDLGATLEKCANLMQDGLAPGDFAAPADVFKVCAMACTRASGSSFGTLMAVAFMTATKETRGKRQLAAENVEPLLGKVLEALMARGKGSLGDKTMLDSLETIRQATIGLTDHSQLLEIAENAAQSALNIYRDKPNKIGRARMFAEKSKGMDDPGMVAVQRIIGNLD